MRALGRSSSGGAQPSKPIVVALASITHAAGEAQDEMQRRIALDVTVVKWRGLPRATVKSIGNRCGGQVRDQRRKVALAVVILAARHTAAVAPEQDSVVSALVPLGTT